MSYIMSPTAATYASPREPAQPLKHNRRGRSYKQVLSLLVHTARIPPLDTTTTTTTTVIANGLVVTSGSQRQVQAPLGGGGGALADGGVEEQGVPVGRAGVALPFPRKSGG